MSRTGRPANRAAWLAVLAAIEPGASRAEVEGATGLAGDRLRHYLRGFEERRLIAFARNFSHLPTDGPGAARYVLTSVGATLLAGLRADAGLSATLARRAAESPPAPSASPPLSGLSANPAIVGGSTDFSPPRRPPAPSRVYAQVGPSRAHNFCYRLLILGGPTKDPGWGNPTMMPGRWLKYHMEFEHAHLERNEGRVPILYIKVRSVESDDPLRLEAIALDRATRIARIFESRYGYHFSEPERRGVPKFSAPSDPATRFIRANGVSIHGEHDGPGVGVGTDDTDGSGKPAPGTVEYTEPRGALSAEASAQALKEHTEGIRFLGGGVDRLRAEVSSQRSVTDAILARLAEMGRGDEARGRLQLGLDLRLTALENAIHKRNGNGTTPAGEWGEGRAA